MVMPPADTVQQTPADLVRFGNKKLGHQLGQVRRGAVKRPQVLQEAGTEPPQGRAVQPLKNRGAHLRLEKGPKIRHLGPFVLWQVQSFEVAPQDSGTAVKRRAETRPAKGLEQDLVREEVDAVVGCDVAFRVRAAVRPRVVGPIDRQGTLGHTKDMLQSKGVDEDGAAELLLLPHRCDVLGPLDEEDVAGEDGEADGDERARILAVAC
jgi:hypothetical protein